MTMTVAPARASFSELRCLVQAHVGIYAWVELRKQQACRRDWGLVPSPEAARRLQGNYGGMQEWAAAGHLARRVLRHTEPNCGGLPSWLGRVAVDLLTADVAVILLCEPVAGGGGLFGGDVQCLQLLDASTIEPVLDNYGVLLRYMQYGREVPRRDFAAVAAGPPGLRPLRYMPAARCLYLSMDPQRESPFGWSPLERAIERREDGTIDVDATAANLPPADDVTWAEGFHALVRDGLFNALLDRCGRGDLRWQWKPVAA